MIKNNLLVAWRNFTKHRTFGLINIIGFSLAMVSCFLIAFHIQSELSYEKNFPKHKQLYRVHPPGWAKSPPPLAEALTDYFPEIRSAARFYDYGSRILSYDDMQLEVKNGFMADSSAVEMFDLEFVSGSAEKSLRVPFTIVLTETLAKKLFKGVDPVDKIIKINNNRDYVITGIVKDFPENTHLKMSYLISFSTLYKMISGDWMAARGWMGPYTYIYVDPAEIPKVMEKLGDFRVKFYEGTDTPENIRANQLLEFQPVTDIHLYSHLEQELSENSNGGYLYIFGAVAIFIILIASVNFINLNISLAFRRMKETGMRKVMGAFRMQLIRQYLTETLLVSAISLLLSLVLFVVALPTYNQMTNRTIKFTDVLTVNNFGVMAALVLAVSLVSGLYPALFMSRFRPIESLKGQKSPGSSTSSVRKALVVFQFAVSIFMIAGTIIIYRQMQFFESKELGFDRERVMGVKLYGEMRKKFSTNQEGLKSALKSNPSVLEVGAVSDLPGEDFSVEGIRPVGVDPSREFPSFRVTRGDYDWLTALNIQLVTGRNFSPDFNDSANFILNEAAVKALGLNNPVGSKIENVTFGKQGTVVGVVKDFHFASLHNSIEPLAIEYDPEAAGYLLVKISESNTQDMLKYVETTMKQVEPTNLFTYTFIEDQWNAQYREENKMNVLFNAFSIFMIGISCIGLFGLSAIAIETRKKEISIRKVVGATSGTIISIISRESITLVLIGAAIAIPTAWYAMNQWLARFTYKIEVTPDVFIITLITALAVAFAAVLFNALKAVTANPVKSLRSE